MDDDLMAMGSHMYYSLSSVYASSLNSLYTLLDINTSKACPEDIYRPLSRSGVFAYLFGTIQEEQMTCLHYSNTRRKF